MPVDVTAALATLQASGWVCSAVWTPPPVTLSDQVPQPEVVTPLAGAMGQASRGDHKHPRLTSAGVDTLGAAGEQTIVFTRTFLAKPSVFFCLYEAADNQPVILKVKSWTQDGSNNYTGCVVKGYRSVPVPQNLATLLLGAVFNLFGGSAASVEFGYVAVQVTT